MNIFLDLDGVMADFDLHFSSINNGNFKPESMTDKEMWSIINSHPT